MSSIKTFNLNKINWAFKFYSYAQKTMFFSTTKMQSIFHGFKTQTKIEK